MKRITTKGIALGALVALLASACGGGTSVETSEVPEPEATVVQADQPESDDADTSDADGDEGEGEGEGDDQRPPDQDAANPTPTPLATPAPEPTATAEPEQAPFDPTFCDAGSTLLATSDAADGIDPTDNRIVEAWFTELLVASDNAVAAAPDEPFTTATARYREIVTAIRTLAAEFDFEVTSPEADAAFDDQLDAEADEFGELQLLLEDYVYGTCEVDRTTVTDRAESIAIAITETVIPPPPPSGTVPIVDSLGVIALEVPFEWTSISENPGLDSMTLVASTDIGEYVNGWTTSGIEITVVPFDGRFDLMDIAPESRAAFDCELVEVDEYDDDRLIGQITLYERCLEAGGTLDTTGTSAAVIAATTADGDHAVLVQLTLTEIDTPLLPLLLLTLEIDPSGLPTP